MRKTSKDLTPGSDSTRLLLLPLSDALHAPVGIGLQGFTGRDFSIEDPRTIRVKWIEVWGWGTAGPVV